jgi:hypothetical protein
LDSLFAETLQEVVDFFTKIDGVTDHELIEHEPIGTSEPWSKTLWTVTNGKIVCHLIYDPDDEQEPNDEFEGLEWGYRVYLENSYPCMNNAPLRMLEACRCPGDKWAVEWRERVLSFHRVDKKDWQKYL